MRPLAVATVAVPRPRRVTFARGIGWLVTHRAERSVTILGPGLDNPVRVGVPVAAPAFTASISERHLAAVTLDELVVCDRQGRPLWRRDLAIAPAGLPCEPNCHLDTQGVLWLYLPQSEGGEGGEGELGEGDGADGEGEGQWGEGKGDGEGGDGKGGESEGKGEGGEGDELVAHDAATGEVIGRKRLGSSVGAAGFWPHPDGKRLGLHVAMGQDTPLSHLAALDDGRIAGHDLPGEFLNGFTSAGDRYLSLPHDVREIAIRDVTTGAVIVACDAEEEPGHRLMEAAALVSDDFVLVALNPGGSDVEEHRLLATRSLRRQVDVDYGPLVMPQNSIAATDGRGRWVTDARDGVLRLWQLPERVTDEVDGQQTLW
ncbi:hypothetical protein ACQPZJ_41490 [Actinoplanes sp. CA-054009]